MSKKKKAKKAKRRSIRKAAKRKAPAKDDGRARELVLQVINRLGGSTAVHPDNPDRLIVTQFNHPPFVVDYKRGEVEDVDPGKSESAPVDSTQVAEST